MTAKVTFTHSLDQRQRAAAEAMTFPAYRQHLGAEDHLTFAALDGEAVVGLALWRLGKGRAARLLSLLVAGDCRRQGIGAALLAASIEALGSAADEAVAYWSSTLPGAAAFERLLAGAGWSEKQLDQCRVSGTAKSARDWAQRRSMDRMLARAGWSFKAFDEIGEEERAEIETVVAAQSVPEGWTPFEDVDTDRPVVADLSIVMRQHGAVVGWLTTCRAENGDIWYYRLYNIGASKAAGALMPLIVEVNRRHFLRDGPEARWRWNTNASRPDMLAFLARHADEFCDFHDYHWTSRRLLRAKVEDLVGEDEQIRAVG